MPEMVKKVGRSPMASCRAPIGVEKITWPIWEAIWKPTMYRVADSLVSKCRVK